MSGETKGKHTPGPWTVDRLRIIRNGTQPTGLFNVADCADPTAHQIDGNIEERIANAKLIAAAPELLASLENLSYWMRCHTGPADGTHEMLVEAVNAIKKAGGNYDR